MQSYKISVFVCRRFSTTDLCNGKRNFRKFLLHNRGTKAFKEKQKTNPDPDIPVYNYGVRNPGYKINNELIEVPEMIPELIVPDLKDFKLKPYVSYRVGDVIQPEFTAEDLFNCVYKEKITKDFKAGKLNAEGFPLEPSEEENLRPEEAKLKAEQTGADMFSPRSKHETEEGLRY
uniref:39S ribosomal protein L41, mitochondrial n=1 Tax=Clastoptera arizonana TaxID=38151 RepID=A0A1B6C7L8_9HEMI